ncbi:aluminium activated malate transporter family protein [Striga asiatica]|uniref:Aluminium activated malate transporter family protein n=1 Tax=Striga asiatica TaxID=4170 RepID=A0A5A7RJY7_STRAF|nr:aluminium activated malate transporter family protein [Striga asiatica]
MGSTAQQKNFNKLWTHARISSQPLPSRIVEHNTHSLSQPQLEDDYLSGRPCFGGSCSRFVHRIRALESTGYLSLASFTSLLVEFVARLDLLVEAVDELSGMAKFKQEAA